MPPCVESEGDVIQKTLFDDDRSRSQAEELRLIRHVFLSAIADGREVDAGQGQRRDAYPRGISCAIGPMIASLRRDGLITIAGADYASRPTRRRTVARLWRAANIERCKRQAEADAAWLAARRKDAGESAATDSPAIDPTTNPPSEGTNDGQVK